MNKNNNIEETEDLTELINKLEATEDFTELFKSEDATEKLDTTVEMIRENYVPPKEENHVSDIDEDFSDIMKKRDYKGKVEIKEKKKSKKRKLKKWVYVILLLVFLGGGFMTYKIIHNKKLEQKAQEEKRIIENIKNHFNKFVKVSNDTSLYEKDGDEYKKVGNIYKDVNLELVDEDITLDTKYFHIKDLDYYISYEDVEKGEEQEIDTRYKSYLPFNKNIVTKDSFSIYLDKNKIISLDKEMEFPIIINDYEGKYFVEYNNMLVGISKDDVSKTIDKTNTEKKNQSKITTLCYHRIYDTTDKCTDPYVCLKKEVFDKQMKHLSDNNYLSLTMTELYMYLKGNIQIEKGVVITFDDGYLFKSADEVLDKYHLNGTMFVITGFFKDFTQFDGLKAIDIQSHTDNMHRNYVCSGGNQGGAILCSSKDTIVKDLKTSLEKLNVPPIGLAFPFYDYNENAINALKEVGFKLAFVGRAGTNGKATLNSTNLYKIPRMTVWEESLMSFSTWKGYL